MYDYGIYRKKVLGKGSQSESKFKLRLRKSKGSFSISNQIPMRPYFTLLHSQGLWGISNFIYEIGNLLFLLVFFDSSHSSRLADFQLPTTNSPLLLLLKNSKQLSLSNNIRENKAFVLLSFFLSGTFILFDFIFYSFEYWPRFIRSKIPIPDNTISIKSFDTPDSATTTGRVIVLITKTNRRRDVI